MYQCWFISCDRCTVLTQGATFYIRCKILQKGKVGGRYGETLVLFLQLLCKSKILLKGKVDFSERHAAYPMRTHSREMQVCGVSQLSLRPWARWLCPPRRGRGHRGTCPGLRALPSAVLVDFVINNSHPTQTGSSCAHGAHTRVFRDLEGRRPAPLCSSAVTSCVPLPLTATPEPY